jgi:ABC-type Na+ efflux pump permease subunit
MVGNSKNLVTDVTGSMMLTLRADGSTDTYYEDWTYTFTVSSATVTIAKDGTDSGTYVVADDGGVDLTDTDLASTTDARMTISGNEVAQVVEPQPSVFSLATLACSGDELTATVGSQVATLHREH